ncbi:MAG: serine hydrolase [Pirellulaceae bacterium]|nr:serine hydrolase [Pirellulaceae bacterium]
MFRSIAWLLFVASLLEVFHEKNLEAQSLERRIKPLIEAHRGDVAVAIKNLRSQEKYFYRESEPQSTASLIKFPVLVTAYQLAEQGKLTLDKKLSLLAKDKVQGSGILTTHFSDGLVLSVRDTLRLMIAYSDNTATNMMLDEIGLATTNESMEELGMTNTRIHAKVFHRETSLAPQRSERFGLGSTTASEMLRLFELLESGQLANPENTQAMMAHLYACDDRLKTRRFIPATTKLAHKTGSVDKVRCDSGILESEQGPVAFCILTENNEDQSWGDNNRADLLCAEIGRAMLEHFQSSDDKLPLSAASPIQLGSKGPLIMCLQRTLNARLSPPPKLKLDGEFGDSTQAAVVAFQKSNSLESTGTLNNETWKKIGPLLSADPPATLPNAAASNEKLPAKQPTKEPADGLTGPPLVTGTAWVITDGDTGEVLFEHESQSLRDPASTTKIMTALLVIEHASNHPEVLDEIMTFSRRADGTVGSTSDLFAGEKITVRELLYGLLLPSGNDASVAFAEHFGDRLTPDLDQQSGYAGFIAAMNRRAPELDLPQTSYENSHGLTASDHKSSAQDLAKLARHAWQLPLFREIVSTREHESIVESDIGYSRMVQWRNTNRLLDIEGFDGVKTGTTDAAGACLVSSCHRGDRHLIVVVLGAKSSEARYTETRNLIRWAWNELDVQ